MRSHAPVQERAPALSLEVCDEEGRVVDRVTVRDLSGALAEESGGRHRLASRRHRRDH